MELITLNSQIKFKTSILRSILCDYSNAYIFVSATITVPNTEAAGAAANNRKNIITKNCAPFFNFISEIARHWDASFKQEMMVQNILKLHYYYISKTVRTIKISF